MTSKIAERVIVVKRWNYREHQSISVDHGNLDWIRRVSGISGAPGIPEVSEPQGCRRVRGVQEDWFSWLDSYICEFSLVPDQGPSMIWLRIRPLRLRLGAARLRDPD